MDYKIFIIIPVFNESKNIRSVLSSLVDFDYIVINDGSTDDIAQFLKINNINHLNHDENLGQGAALRTGFQNALYNNYDIVVHFDGDGQHRVQDIPIVVNPIIHNHADIVFGSRFMDKESKKAIPSIKRNILRMARIFEGFRTGIWLTDAHCGLRALKVDSCKSMKLKANGMAHASEIVSETNRLKLKYTEVAVFVNYKDNEKKDNNIKRVFSVLKELLFYKN